MEGAVTPTVLAGDVLRVGRLGSAIFSEDGKRRRWLSRRLADVSRAQLTPKRVGFVMLNPSKADADQPDPTITRCVGFAERERATELEVANLSDWIETDSKKLRGLAARGLLTDTNSWHYLKHVLSCDVVICAWGGHPWARGKLATRILGHVGIEDLRALQLCCLGKTKTGAPNHPLYLAANTPLIDWPEPRLPAPVPTTEEPER
jgi:hypothetical protein